MGNRPEPALPARLPPEPRADARPLVTLLTDFGTRDAFVGVMKGVILARCPEAALIDLTHEVPAFDILGASFVLQSAVPYFPRGTVHLAVVDPGVGGSRRALAARISGQLFVVPDNGLLSYPLVSGRLEALHLVSEEAYRLTPVSATFHGRDVFAPAAGHLAAGLPLGRLGPAARDPIRLPIPRARRDPAGNLLGQVVWIDAFGNCITNIGSAALEAAGARPLHVLLDGRRLPVVRYFEEAAPEEAAALFGSSGYLELFSRQGNLAGRLAVTPGRPVTLVLRGDPPPATSGRASGS
ncbi:MAG TPA: SAM-dependent chlorinase/fluorinase [Candidatus Sulfotelmatobacter sp.]|nr:SAM-dependent chlorinase/fluorinase [Candidatus Sulfotelmatobacter sp.]